MSHHLFEEPNELSPDLSGRSAFEVDTNPDGPPEGDRWSTWDVALHGPCPRPDWVITELGAVDAELAVVGSEEDAAALSALAMPLRVAGPLAPVAARLAAAIPPEWDADLLRTPLYLAPAPVTVPGAPKRALPASGEHS